MYSNISIIIRLVYGENELKSDYFMAFLFQIKSVSKVKGLPPCGRAQGFSMLLNSCNALRQSGSMLGFLPLAKNDQNSTPLY